MDNVSAALTVGPHLGTVSDHEGTHVHDTPVSISQTGQVHPPSVDPRTHGIRPMGDAVNQQAAAVVERM